MTNQNIPTAPGLGSGPSPTPPTPQPATTVGQTVSKVIATLCAAVITWLAVRGIANQQVQGALMLLTPIIGDQIVDHLTKYMA